MKRLQPRLCHATSRRMFSHQETPNLESVGKFGRLIRTCRFRFSPGRAIAAACSWRRRQYRGGACAGIMHSMVLCLRAVASSASAAPMIHESLMNPWLVYTGTTPTRVPLVRDNLQHNLGPVSRDATALTRLQTSTENLSQFFFLLQARGEWPSCVEESTALTS